MSLKKHVENIKCICLLKQTKEMFGCEVGFPDSLLPCQVESELPDSQVHGDPRFSPKKIVDTFPQSPT